LRAFAGPKLDAAGDGDLGEVDATKHRTKLSIGDIDLGSGLEARANPPLLPLDLERAGDHAADGPHLPPSLGERLVAPFVGNLRE
jgi:hypothetical protein